MTTCGLKFGTIFEIVICTNYAGLRVNKRERNLENYAYDFIRNPPGHITEKVQLVVKDPGAKNPWSSSQCHEQLATNKLFEKHLGQRHQIKKFLYMCVWLW